ncbi:hypothetical protein GCM10009799_34480 [Nocardiopsis rhodophaea]|uniref:Uncharacterized protein n=1 Tax=Nocardiopsis rhodophaea TaxID=280238 RepID=A0ABP5ERT5_9ACTN
MSEGPRSPARDRVDLAAQHRCYVAQTHPNWRQTPAHRPDETHKRADNVEKFSTTPWRGTPGATFSGSTNRNAD